MDTRQDVIEKAYTLLMMMEKVTGYAPGEDFYKSVVASLNAAPEEELPRLFSEIAEIVTNSVDKAVAIATTLGKEAVADRESEDRSKEIGDIAELLNF